MKKTNKNQYKNNHKIKIQFNYNKKFQLLKAQNQTENYSFFYLSNIYQINYSDSY